MSSHTVLSVSRSGGWTGLHRIYFNAAVRYLNQREPRRPELIDLYSRLTAEDGTELFSEYLEKLEDFLVLENTIQIYCAMAVEALLNLYGVLRLTESFYKRNVERIGIVQKLEILLATCDDHLLPKDAEITVILRRLSETRNALVHPKVREVALGDTAALEESSDIVKRSIDDMKKFFELFADVSPETKATVHFLDLDI